MQDEDHDADIIWEEEKGAGRRLKEAPVYKIVQYITHRILQGPSFLLYLWLNILHHRLRRRSIIPDDLPFLPFTQRFLAVAFNKA